MSSHHLTATDLTVSYHGVPAIHHISVEFRCGDCVAILGPNGAGKTTLLKALIGLVPLETGSVRYHGHPVRRGAKEIAYLPQRENIDWDFPVTVRGLVDMGRYAQLGWLRPFGPADETAVNEALAALDLKDLQDRQLNALSGGQQQRAFLARSLAQEAHVLLLDEPFAGLDSPSQTALGKLLRQLAGQGHLIIASHHDLNNVTEIFDQVVLLNGECIATGPAAATLTPDNMDRTYGTHIFTGVHS